MGMASKARSGGISRSNKNQSRVARGQKSVNGMLHASTARSGDQNLGVKGDVDGARGGQTPARTVRWGSGTVS